MKILIKNTKHGACYYDASTPEKLDAASRRILKEILDDSYYYGIGIEPLPVMKNPITEEEIEKLPSHLVETERKRLESFKKEVKRVERHNQVVESIQDYLQTKSISYITYGIGTKHERMVPRGYHLLSSVYQHWCGGYTCYVEDVMDATKMC